MTLAEDNSFFDNLIKGRVQRKTIFTPKFAQYKGMITSVLLSVCFVKNLSSTSLIWVNMASMIQIKRQKEPYFLRYSTRGNFEVQNYCVGNDLSSWRHVFINWNSSGFQQKHKNEKSPTWGLLWVKHCFSLHTPFKQH